MKLRWKSADPKIDAQKQQPAINDCDKHLIHTPCLPATYAVILPENPSESELPGRPFESHRYWEPDSQRQFHARDTSLSRLSNFPN
jgi:hypothetical protein